MKTYYVKFSSGDVRLNTGLAPTFLCFNNNGTGVTPPSIAEVLGATGIYSFSYGTTTPICFLIDGATTGLGSNRYVSGAIDPADRADEYGNTLVAIGNSGIALGTTGVALGTTAVALGTTSVALGITAVAIGTSTIAFGNTAVALGNSAVAIGTTAVSYLAAMGASESALETLIGNTSSSLFTPTTLFGYMMRLQQDLEGNQTFTKSSGSLQYFDTTGASLLFTKTIANSASLVTRT